ncbi:MAG TPA: hypothetical protein VGI81_22955 [Tepidisphaeraceae bacterium]
MGRVGGFLLALMVVSACAPAAGASGRDFTEWAAGAGGWTDAKLWGGQLPDPFHRAEVHGKSDILIPRGTYVIGDLEIGLKADDRASVTVDGGQLILMQDALRIGEVAGGEGSFTLRAGAMHCPVDVCVGAANGVPGRETSAALRIRGGSFLSRTLITGIGWGAHSHFAVEGSRASAIHVLDCCFFEAFADADGTPGDCLVSFTLDEHGVTPITIQSPYRGLQINKDARSHCRLAIRLAAVPPRDDVTLVSTRVPVRGTFDDLPDGSEISADYQGHSYRWTITYRGGPAGHDLVLKNKSQYAPDAPVTHTLPIPVPPKALWMEHPVYPLPAKWEGRPAFAGAEGFGAFTPGGRGGQTLYVENLNDSGPGSLRAAIQTPGPRTILFHVGGAIRLKSTLRIDEPFVTIDGSTAPGGGILIRQHGIEVRSHDVVLRYLRIRVGDDDVHLDQPKAKETYAGGAGEHALYFIDEASNCIADHLSLSWSTTKILSVTKLSDRITVQWCLLSESLNFAGHGYASLAGGNRVTWHHNLFAHNESRNVRFQGLVDADFRNNVIYDWGERAAYGEFDRLNYVNNYLKPGASTWQKPYLFFHIGDAEVMPGSIYLKGNIIDGRGGAPGVNKDNWRGMGYYYFERNTLAAADPFPAPPVTMQSADDAYGHVLKDVGATRPQRDSVDERILREVSTDTGHIINRLSDVGGWPDFPAAARAQSPQ